MNDCTKNTFDNKALVEVGKIKQDANNVFRNKACMQLGKNKWEMKNSKQQTMIYLNEC